MSRPTNPAAFGEAQRTLRDANRRQSRRDEPPSRESVTQLCHRRHRCGRRGLRAAHDNKNRLSARGADPTAVDLSPRSPTNSWGTKKQSLDERPARGAVGGVARLNAVLGKPSLKMTAVATSAARVPWCLQSTWGSRCGGSRSSPPTNRRPPHPSCGAAVPRRSWR